MIPDARRQNPVCEYNEGSSAEKCPSNDSVSTAFVEKEHGVII
jgi:hypothetical protein